MKFPTVGDSNDDQLQIEHAFKLRVRFGDDLYRGLFLVAERLLCPFIVGSKFLNEHVEAIRSTLGRVQFIQSDLPIIGNGKTEKSWTVSENAQAQHEKAMRSKSHHEKTGDKSSTRTNIWLCRIIGVPEYTQV